MNARREQNRKIQWARSEKDPNAFIILKKVQL